jgi:glucose/arabinose dehydrogenase
MRTFSSKRILFLVTVLAGSVGATAQAPDASSTAGCEGVSEVSGTALDVELVAVDFKNPVHLASPSRNRLFVVEQAGLVRIVKNGKTLSKPFMDLRSRVRSGGERGLLSIAFHPDFALNGRFFLYYTDLTGDIVISEFRAAAANPDQADPTTERRMLTIPHRKYANHNGGQLAFGPQRYLYIGVGDGGSAGDPDNHGQDPAVLLGKILRIDVDKSEGPNQYGIPPTNPFVRAKGAAPEIWAYGLRNPWRFSFDRETGDLYIADVGQNAWEEIDVQPGSSLGGENYGWRYMEGTHCYDPPEDCPRRGLTLPVVEYPTPPRAAVTGGFVYRGCKMPDLRGTYFYSDYYKGFIRSFVLSNGQPSRTQDVTNQLKRSHNTIHHLSSFGEDAGGELYLIEHIQGAIYRIIPARPHASP